MTTDELRAYQTAAFATAIYPNKGRGTSIYPYLKLCGEAGEVAEKFGKRIRDGDGGDTEAWRQSLLKELGDVMWYCAAIATEEAGSLTVSTNIVEFNPVIEMCLQAARGNTTSVMSYVKHIAEQNGSTLAEVAAINLAKLASRAERGTLSGSGDER